MKRIAAVLMLVVTSSMANDDDRDWIAAESGIRVGSTKAFAGCTPSSTEADENVQKIAILKAQANIARSRNIDVSGEEHISGDHYSNTISEISASTIHPLSVIEQELALIDGRLNLCVLVVEK
jgi:hypothetical protein